MKKIIGGLLIILFIILIFSSITNAFFGNAHPENPISEGFNLFLLGSGLIGIATWGRKKFR